MVRDYIRESNSIVAQGVPKKRRKDLGAPRNVVSAMATPYA